MTATLSTPSVTVVIPVHNGAAFVADAIESVLAQLAEAPVELLVVDDGSTDETPAILTRYGERLRVVTQPNRGLPAARNAGIAHGRGSGFAFLDADDLHPRGYVARFLDAARQRPDAAVFHCAWRAVDFEGREQYGNTAPLDLDDDPFHRLLSLGAPHIGALFVRRSAIDRAGGFDERLRLQEDWDYWLRLAAAGLRFSGVPGNVLLVRRRAGSMSATAGSALALTGLQVLERHLARHRCAGPCTSAEARASWRLAALRATARDLTARTGVPGRPGRWLGTGLAVLRRPNLASALRRG